MRLDHLYRSYDYFDHNNQRRTFHPSQPLPADVKSLTNQLSQLSDTVANNTYTVDIDNQSTGNYSYDKIDNLTGDVAEGIGSIDWTVYGKIKAINKQSGTDLLYGYDAAGNRTVKKVTEGGTNKFTYYVRDAQGNTLAVYTRDGSGAINWSEQHLYGSSRLGLWQWSGAVPQGAPLVTTSPIFDSLNYGSRTYEITNHLSNVLATVSDKKIGLPLQGNSSLIDYYTADLLSAQDYYPFGMQMPGRMNTSDSYRYGFNGKENDNEVKGDGSQQDYGMRIYDPRLGKFLSVDPLTKDFPWYSPYQFAGNDPIRNTDLDGAEPQSRTEEWNNNLVNISIYDDPQLGVIGVESVYDKATGQNWFIHQGNDGQKWYWKHKNGAKEQSSLIQSRNPDRANGSWEKFETANHIAADKAIMDKSFHYLMVGVLLTPGAILGGGEAAAVGSEALPTVAKYSWQSIKWMGKTFGKQLLEETGKEFISNRFNVKEMDWFDVATSTVGSKLNLSWKGNLLLGALNSTTDISYKDGPKYIGGEKTIESVGIDLLFEVPKVGINATFDTFNNSKLRSTFIDIMMGQAKKTTTIQIDEIRENKNP